MKKLIILLLFQPFAYSIQAQIDTTATVSLAESVHGDDSSSHGFVASALRWYDAHMNYSAVAVLMTVERWSSLLPSMWRATRRAAVA